MYKRVIDPNRSPQLNEAQDENWLDLANATVEVSSEEPEHPIENALLLDADEKAFWRAAASGTQTVRVLFDKPQALSRIYLVFEERDVPRSQEFVVGWSTALGDECREVVRQQWNFNPETASVEIEDFNVRMDAVRVLQIVIRPDHESRDSRATMRRLRLS
jgi:hypothetical protein